jgi:hypothetical protein
MLWDMIRYENFDVDSPYNRAAAQWAKEQTVYQLPLDRRTLRDASPQDHADDFPIPETPWLSNADLLPADDPQLPGGVPGDDRCRSDTSNDLASIVSAEIVFVDDEVVEAEIVEADSASRAGAEILFIE